MSYCCNFILADCVIAIETDFPVPISSRFEPFLTNASADFTVSFQQTASLPSLDGETLTADDTRMALAYRQRDQVVYALCRDSYQKAIAHVTVDYRNRRGVVRYLPGNKNRFQTMDACFDSFGLEHAMMALDTFVVHASFIRYQGKGYLFMGPSGIGKSTAAKVWTDHTEAELLNGDRVLVRKINGVWQGFGSPFAGSSQCHKNESASIAAVIALCREDSSFQRITPGQGFRSLYINTAVCPWDERYHSRALNLLDAAAKELLFYRMSAPPDERMISLMKNGLNLL